MKRRLPASATAAIAALFSLACAGQDFDGLDKPENKRWWANTFIDQQAHACRVLAKDQKDPDGFGTVQQNGVYLISVNFHPHFVGEKRTSFCREIDGPPGTTWVRQDFVLWHVEKGAVTYKDATHPTGCDPLSDIACDLTGTRICHAARSFFFGAVVVPLEGQYTGDCVNGQGKALTGPGGCNVCAPSVWSAE